MKLVPGSQEWLQWGADEGARRDTEMQNITTQATLERVQEACRKRRNTVGLNAGQVITAMSEAKRKGIKPTEVEL